ncbi:FAST kinase domain 1 [Turdus rufiventris]|nr:FAST kinase domain 1 [Turdus rufiventris]
MLELVRHGLQNKVEHMEDEVIVDILYSILRLGVEDHASLAKVLVTEAWKRLERQVLSCCALWKMLSLPALSKFALCLYKQHRQFSPIIGQVAHIVDMKLDSIQDLRILSVLMISISEVITESFRDRLLHKAEQLLQEKDEVHFNYARRILQFLQNVKLRYHPLLEKCNKIFLENASDLDIHSISHIFGLYEQLGFDSAEFRLVVKELLSETIDDNYDPETFAKLFFSLGPMAGSKVNFHLVWKTITYPNGFCSAQTFGELSCVTVGKVNTVLGDAALPGSGAVCQTKNVTVRAKEMIINKAAAVLPQCRLHHLNCIATALVKWNHHGQLHWQNSSELCAKLLQRINDCALQRLQKANNLNLLLEELPYVNGEWFGEVLNEESLAMCQHLIDQITWENILPLSFFLIKSDHRCPALFDRISSVTVESIDKIPPSEIYFILFLFSTLNYDPPDNEEFFKSCHLEAYHLVLLGHVLAMAGYFPPALITTIFNVSFLSKLDAQLKGKSRINPQRQHIHRMLTEILGGRHYSRISVLTPYSYEIDFECVLDVNKKPLSYMAQNIPLDSSRGIHLRHGIKDEGRKALPPGAQRIALEFLDSKAFSRDYSRHLKGEPAVKKRHLEMLGYRVVQIPHFEWNSMVLSTKGEQLEYLRQQLYGIQ